MRFALALCLGAMAVFAAGEGAAEKEVAAASEGLRQAMLHGDVAAMTRLMHPDLTYEHSSAKTETRAETIAALTRPGGEPKAIEFHEGTTRIFGNTALYKGRADFTNAAGVVSHLDVLMVWIKTNGAWQLVARHSTKVQN